MSSDARQLLIKTQEFEEGTPERRVHPGHQKVTPGARQAEGLLGQDFVVFAFLSWGK